MFDPVPRSPISRRAFLTGSVCAAAGMALIAESGLWSRMLIAAGDSIRTRPGEVTLIAFDDAGKRLGPQRIAKLVRTDAQWRRQLTPLSFAVLRQGATEMPFSGPLNNNFKAGLYRCLGCQNALFSSATKYDPGDGWPSFWAPLARQNMVERTDYSDGMVRTEVRCARCESHLGHLFHDGPPLTGLRYCMDSAALDFHPCSAKRAT